MSWLGRIFRLGHYDRDLFDSGPFDRRKAELDEEMRAHLAMDVADRVARGETREQAEAAAQREFGNLGLARDRTHGVWRWGRLESLTRNLQYALRVLRRSPGFSLTVVATLAVGIGATCAMFTVVDRVLLRQLPYRDAGRLVELREAGVRGEVNYGSPYLDLDQWRQRARSLEQIAFYSVNTKRVAFLEGNTGAVHVREGTASANLFALLGVAPAMGRGFLGRDAGGSVNPADEHGVLLSDAAWRDEFGADPAMVGKTIQLNGERLTVLGVMPRGFTFPSTGSVAELPMVWRPIVLGEDDFSHEHNVAPRYEAIGRLREGVTTAQADAELKTAQTAVAMSYDADDREQISSATVTPYTDMELPEGTRPALLALFCASGLLWLIACVNVTSLMLARATARQREIAVRGALGASRWQIVQQLLLEGLLLSGGASLLGLGLTAVMLKLFEHGLAAQFDLHERLVPNAAVLAALLGLTIVSALVISAWPALGAARAPIEAALRQGAPQQGMGRAQHRVRAVLVVTQIALSLTLLVGCGLLLRTLYALRHVPLGFQTDHIVVAHMEIPAYKFAGRNMTTELYQPLVERVKHLPGVESATLQTEVPLGKTFQMMFTFWAQGQSEDAKRKRALQAQFRAVGPEMQQVFGFKMLRGRFFNEGDTAGSAAVIVVNRAFVRAFFGDDRDPSAILGHDLIGFEEKRRSTVVGVLEDERQVAVAEPSQPEMEVSIPQITPKSMFYRGAEQLAMDLAVRTERDPDAVTAEVREAMRQASSDLAASRFTTMDQVVEDSFGSQNLAARLLEIFGGSALLLCLAGIYGLLAYLVAQRRREMGLRIALGARRWSLMWLVLRQAGLMLAVGLAIGLGLAWFTSVGLRTFLYGVKPADPWTMAAVAALLFVGGLAASLIPARRAAGVNPMEALRAE
jgi:putative ABC transport system permease protein